MTEAKLVSLPVRDNSVAEEMRLAAIETAREIEVHGWCLVAWSKDDGYAVTYNAGGAPGECVADIVSRILELDAEDEG